MNLFGSVVLGLLAFCIAPAAAQTYGSPKKGTTTVFSSQPATTILQSTPVSPWGINLPEETDTLFDRAASDNVTSMSISGPQINSGTLANACLGPAMSNHANVYPQYGNAIHTTATTTNGSPTVVVSSAAGIANGQQAFATFFPIGSVVTNVVGSTITLSQSSTATNVSPVAVRFENNRWSTTSSILSNTIGAKNLYVGGAALGNGSWMNKWSPGSDFAGVTPLFALAPAGGGGVAAFFGSRSSDNIGGFGSALTTATITVLDTLTANPNSWGYYNEANLVSPTVGYHMNEESSIYSEWAYVPTDPYSYNQLGAARNTRLDCGKGAGTGTPQNCSASLEIIQNGAKYGKGIVFGRDAMVPSIDGTQIAVSMAKDQAIHWFRAKNTPAWSIVSTKDAGTARTLTLSNNAVTASQGTDIATGGHFFAATGEPDLSSCGSGSPTLTPGSTDSHGTITEGIMATGCILTFLKAYAIAPVCVVSSPTANLFSSYSTTTTTLTIVNTAGSGNRYSYICMGG